MRAFIALPIGSEVRQRLHEVIRALDALLPRRAVRWTRPEQVHITLRFLGEVPEAAMDEIAAGVRAAAAGTPRLSLRAEQVGAFPAVNRPRVLWVGVTGDLAPLNELQQRITAATAPHGEPDEREFHPHLTLGRVKNLPPRELRAAAEALSRFRVEDLGGWVAGHVQLMRSELAPGGSRHTELAAIPLTAT